VLAERATIDGGLLVIDLSLMRRIPVDPNDGSFERNEGDLGRSQL